MFGHGCVLLLQGIARGSTLTPAGERAIEAYETLQTEINNVIATRADTLIATITEK